MTDTAEYVVLSEGEDMHFVVVRWPSEGLLRVVAAFKNRDRAVTYADMEGMWLHDSAEDFADLPTVTDAMLPDQVPPEPESLMPRLMRRAPATLAIGTPRERKAAKAAGATKAAGAAMPPREEKVAKQAGAVRTARPEGTAAEPERIDPEPQEADAADAEAPAERIDTDDGDRLAPRYDAKLARDERIRELWPTDMTLAMIGEEVGISTSSVSLAAKRMGLPSRLYRCGQRPADLSEAEEEAEPAPPGPVPAPSPPPAPKVAPETNGHVFTMHGVSLTHEEVSFNGKELWINESQYRALHALLRAAPHPIGVPHLVGKVYPGKRKEEAETVFGILVKDLSKNLPSIGLGIMDIKGVGIALTGSDA